MWLKTSDSKDRCGLWHAKAREIEKEKKTRDSTGDITSLDKKIPFYILLDENGEREFRI